MLCVFLLCVWYFVTLGEMLNVSDAYAHPNFFSGIDEMTGFKTRYLVLWRLFSVFTIDAWLNQLSDIVNKTTLCLKKLCKIVFVRTSSNFHQFFKIFGRKIAKRLKLCEMHSFSTSPNSRHHTTVLNADVPNCYTTLIMSIRLLTFASSIH